METKSIQQIVNSYSFKMIVVSFLAILLLIPSFLIQDLIRERIALSDGVKKELYSQWGGKQVVAGPVLNVPFIVDEPTDNRESAKERKGIAHFLPETLKTDGVLHPQTRQRGIYQVVVYEGKLKMKGSFVQPDVSRLDVKNARFNWDKAYFTVGISDMRSVKNVEGLSIEGQKYNVEPGVADTDLFQSGMTIKADSIHLKKTFDFEMTLDVNGSEDLSIEALGKTSEVTLQSDWSQPSFTGDFLPTHRQVTSKGFTADWKVTHLNRNFPQQWIDDKYKTHEAKTGVELLIPVDHYQKAMRSAKYAILFIALNFIIFFFLEIKSKTRIHPFQYSLVAFALLLFYSLLTSISEQIGFNQAYLISAVAVTSLISWYAHSLLRSLPMAGWVALLQSGLYLFLFTILQLQDYALLAGSIGLFLILAIVMKASQQIKWYAEV